MASGLGERNFLFQALAKTTFRVILWQGDDHDIGNIVSEVVESAKTKLRHEELSFGGIQTETSGSGDR